MQTHRWLTFPCTQGKQAAPGGGAFWVQGWVHGLWFSMWKHTADETDVWPLLFKPSACVICSRSMPASIFRRDIDSPWPCPWASVFLWIQSWLSTKPRRQACSQSCPHLAPEDTRSVNLLLKYFMSLSSYHRGPGFGPWHWTRCAFVLFGTIMFPVRAYQLLVAFIIVSAIMWQGALLLTYDIPFDSTWLNDSHTF